MTCSRTNVTYREKAREKGRERERERERTHSTVEIESKSNFVFPFIPRYVRRNVECTAGLFRIAVSRRAVIRSDFECKRMREQAAHVARKKRVEREKEREREREKGKKHSVQEASRDYSRLRQ